MKRIAYVPVIIMLIAGIFLGLSFGAPPHDRDFFANITLALILAAIAGTIAIGDPKRR